MPSTESERVLFDAGMFVGAPLTGDSRHAEENFIYFPITPNCQNKKLNSSV